MFTQIAAYLVAWTRLLALTGSAGRNPPGHPASLVAGNAEDAPTQRPS
ncbi:hypothetical protein [Actinoallomurus acanthiterrae]